jgi:hypothetical protein
MPPCSRVPPLPPLLILREKTDRSLGDICVALHDLAERNTFRVQSWLDNVARKEPAEALRLWLALLRYVTPTLQAAAIADLTPKSTRARLANMTDEDLMEVVVQSPEAAELVKQGVRTEEELLLGLISGPRPRANSLARPLSLCKLHNHQSRFSVFRSFCCLSVPSAHEVGRLPGHDEDAPALIIVPEPK